MNSKYLITLFLLFGLVFTVTECGRLAKRSFGDESDESDEINDSPVDTDNSDDSDLNGSAKRFFENHLSILKIFS